jgi:thiamine biosynthesis protein ThiS
MSIHVNGKAQECSADETLEGLAARIVRSSDLRGIAIILNDEVVPRTRWKEIKLVAESRIEILRATAGG